MGYSGDRTTHGSVLSLANEVRFLNIL